jgi:hypothetical protein
MTTEELAQLIEDAYPRGFVKDAADLLRQQAKEIAMLKQIIDANNLQSDIGQFKKEKYSDEWWKEVALLNKTFPFGGWK